MKKITIALLLILSVTMVSAQPKSAADAQKAIEKALAASQDAKKAAKPATWISLADAYVAAYDFPAANLMQNSSQMEIKLLLKGQQVLGTSTVQGTEGPLTVDSYADKDLYYNEAGALQFWIVTKPVMEEDMLALAVNALGEATKVDPKGSKAKDIAEKLEAIHGKYNTDAFAYYLKGDMAKAAEYFQKTAGVYENTSLNKVDSIIVYYTGMVAGFAGNNELAIASYKKCADMGFYQEGNVFSNMAEIYRKSGDVEAQKKALEDGFAAYPQSQGILVGLINLYRETGDDPQRMFDLLHQAQANEPGNASLFYVEGDIYKQMGETEKAVEMYNKSSEVDPNYVFGFLGIGMMYYDNAIAIQEKANEEFDDAKYMALNNQMEEALASAIEPFEAAFEKSNDMQIKVAVAEYLKNIYFRLRDKDASYPEKNAKYKAFFDENYSPAE